ncbi:MAG: hypothetical protein KJ771_00025 [Nanoarchaeota archaeon]|nr:hypothetical protein [Nanoarchaeota archaeon]
MIQNHRQDATGQSRLIYYKPNGFATEGYDQFRIALGENDFRDLFENPSKIVRFLDFNLTTLWEREDPTGTYSLNDVVKGRTRIKFGRSLKTEQEYDAFLEKVREMSSNQYGHILKDFDKKLRKTIRGEDTEFERVYYDEAYCDPNFRFSAPNLERTQYGEILVEDWINGGQLGRHYGFFFLGESERHIDSEGCDLTHEGCEFLGKYLGLKLSIVDASVLIKEGLLPPTEIVARALAPFGDVAHYEVPLKGPKLVMEPLGK